MILRGGKATTSHSDRDFIISSGHIEQIVPHSVKKSTIIHTNPDCIIHVASGGLVREQRRQWLSKKIIISILSFFIAAVIVASQVCWSKKNVEN